MIRVIALISMAGVALAAPPKSLYDRLGQKPGIAAAVDKFLARAAADPRISGRLFNQDPVKAPLAEFLCAASGGPCQKPALPDLKWLQIVDEEWQAFIEDLGAELGPLVAPLQGQVVHPPADAAKQHDSALAEKAKQLAFMLHNAKKTAAGDLLDAAVTARLRGQRSYAEALFSAAELRLRPDAISLLAPLFREGAPPRVNAKKQAAASAPQPKGALGSSDEDDPPKKSVVSGVYQPLGAVMLWPAGKLKRAPKPRVVELRDGDFAPHLLVVPLGSTVSFPNFDSVYHDVFSRSPAKAFDLGLYKNGEAREVSFDKEGVVRLDCDLHASAPAWVVVTAAPYYTVTDSDGKFQLRGLLPGKYKLRAWSEKSEVTQLVEIKAGDNALTLQPQPTERAPATDKFGVPR